MAGPPLVGFMLNWGLLGVLLVQVYLYHVLFPRDKIHFKVLVYGVFSLDCVQTAILSQDVFYNFVYRWGEASAFYTIGTGWFSFIILGGIISAIVQATFAWRLWLLTRSRILVGAVVLLTITQVSGAVVGGLRLRISSTAEDQIDSIVPLSIWLLGSAVVDVVIAISMTVLLSHSKANGQAFKANLHANSSFSEPVVNRLILFVIETGSLTATIAIITLVTFFASPYTHLHECSAIIIAKLYSNTLLAGFNNRARLHNVAPTSSLPSLCGNLTTASFDDYPELESVMGFSGHPSPLEGTQKK